MAKASAQRKADHKIVKIGVEIAAGYDIARIE